MSRPYRPLRSRFTRLLACVLVVASLLGNGLAFAHSVPAKKDCCAEMSVKMKHAGGCADSGAPCPASDSDCDGQCLFRCQSNAALPVLALVVAPMQAVQPALPVPKPDPHRGTSAAPELRPPILG
jgi:hypothetical protein